MIGMYRMKKQRRYKYLMKVVLMFSKHNVNSSLNECIFTFQFSNVEEVIPRMLPATYLESIVRKHASWTHDVDNSIRKHATWE